ncbi:thioredoxin family protein [Nonomuraea guangzhouensis]|uniref:Thioredoxin family protein n=1 Tax=Nonomuraea guangzhouensis TaxID=1291555 RepID=A0ABW4GST4_9ACTN|nr:thioredoxin family protein [Nonomuraea guangzhouensis]
MEIKVLTVPDCPNQQLAAERLRQALAETGLSTTDLTTHVIADQAEAERYGFTGSPTILIDGRDPFAEPGAPSSLSCRLYRTPDGPAGAPGLDQLRQALRAVADSDTEL